MKAAQFSKYGDPEVIEITEVEKPSIKPDQVLVKVHAASLNPFDYKVRRGYMKEMIPLTLPVTIGGDFAGVITEVGSDVSNFAVGDGVFGQANVVGGGSGTLAEFVAAKATDLAKKPQSIDFLQASAAPLVGVSALQALVQHMKLSSGQKVLIHGGAGGIGSVAIQLAKSLGAYVATTASGQHSDFVKKLGADEVIDYKKQQFETMLKDYDGVYDTVGGDTYKKSFVVLKKGGVIVSMAAQPDTELDKKYEVTTIGQFTKVTTEKLEHLSKLIDEGKITIQIEKTFPLEQAKEAYTFLETGHPKGKVVVTI
jgi:alcohol dehydrogenase